MNIRDHFTHALIVEVSDKAPVIAASFFAPDDIAAGKIARATVRTWVAATKKDSTPILKDNVRLKRLPTPKTPTT